MKKNENNSNNSFHHHHRRHNHSNDESNILLNQSLNKSIIAKSDEWETPSPTKLKTNSQTYDFNDISNASFKQNTQSTILKLRSIIEEKTKLISIQKERIAKLTDKSKEDQITLMRLNQSFKEHKSSLSELQHENQLLQESYNELKSSCTRKNNESKDLYEKIKQMDIDTENLNKEIPLLEQKLAEYQTEESVNNSQIDLIIQSKNLMINDNEKMKNQIIELKEFKDRCEQFESTIPNMQERISQLQQEVAEHNSIIKTNKSQLDQLIKENTLLKNQNQDESKMLRTNQIQYSSLKNEVETKIQLQTRFIQLQENLSKNKQCIDEAESHIKNKDEYLNSLVKFNEKKLQESLSLKNLLLSLQDEMNNVKQQLVQLMMENANSKQTLNNKIEEIVNNELEKSEAKVMQLLEKERIMKKEVENMRNVVKKLEIYVNNILIIHKQMDDENKKHPLENVSTFDFTDTNFSNLQKSIKNLEDNNDAISFLIEDNKNQKDNLQEELNNEVPNLPKQTVEEKAAKYGLF